MRVLVSASLFIVAITVGQADWAWATNGHILHGSGAINASLGGAGIARAFDVFGGSVNPATLVGLRQQAEMGIEIFLPERSLASSVDAGAFGPSFGPAGDMAGSTKSGSSTSFLPSLAANYLWGQDGATLAVIFQGIAGFGVDYGVSDVSSPNANPILTPQPPGGFGFGHIFSEYKLMTLKLAAAMPVGDRLSLGFALVPAMSELQVDPFPATNPVDANGDGFPTYPNTPFDKAFGFGFQLGATYDVTERLRVGANYSSPIWFESFDWPVRDEGMSSRHISFNLDYPAIAGVGASYQLRPDTVLVADVRGIFYSDTDGFDKEGFNADGSVAGFGWKDIFVAGVGLQFQPSEQTSLRLGYNYNSNPLPQRLTFFNVSSPAIVQHRITAGAGYDISDNWQANVTYYHAFEESISGPFVGAGGPIANTSITSSLSEDSVAFQITRFLGS